MINFDTELDTLNASRLVVQTTVPVVTDTLTVRRPESRTTHAGKPLATWNWEDLRSYVVAEIQARWGDFPRDPVKERGIFMAFYGRWGAQAAPIAKFAFEQCDGIWKGSPVSVYRFCKNSDAYFAQPISERL